MKSLLSVVACLAEFGPRETQERSSAATGPGNQKSRRGPNALLHVSWVGCASGPSLLYSGISFIWYSCPEGCGSSHAWRSLGTRLASRSGKKAEKELLSQDLSHDLT